MGVCRNHGYSTDTVAFITLNTSTDNVRRATNPLSFRTQRPKKWHIVRYVSKGSVKYSSLNPFNITNDVLNQAPRRIRDLWISEVNAGGEILAFFGLGRVLYIGM